MKYLTASFTFHAAHRIWKQGEHNQNLHGHTFRMKVTARTDVRPKRKKEIKYKSSDLKNLIQGWITENWDHALLLKGNDPIAKIRHPIAKIRHDARPGPKSCGLESGRPGSVWAELFPTQKAYIFGENPSAEILARYMILKVGPAALNWTPLELITVQVWETDSCSATVGHPEQKPKQKPNKFYAIFAKVFRWRPSTRNKKLEEEVLSIGASIRRMWTSVTCRNR